MRFERVYERHEGRSSGALRQNSVTLLHGVLTVLDVARQFEFNSLRQRVLSLRILRPNRRNNPLLRLHLRDARHPEKTTFKQFVRKIRPKSLLASAAVPSVPRTHDRVDSTTGLAEMWGQ